MSRTGEKTPRIVSSDVAGHAAPVLGLLVYVFNYKSASGPWRLHAPEPGTSGTFPRSSQSAGLLGMLGGPAPPNRAVCFCL